MNPFAIVKGRVYKIHIMNKFFINILNERWLKHMVISLQRNFCQIVC